MYNDMEGGSGRTNFLNLHRRTISGKKFCLSFVLNTREPAPNSPRVLFCGSRRIIANRPYSQRRIFFTTTTTSAFHNFPPTFFRGRACLWSLVTFALESIIQRPPTIRAQECFGIPQPLLPAIIHECLPIRAADDISSVISSIIFCVRCSVAYFRHGSTQTFPYLTFKGGFNFRDLRANGNWNSFPSLPYPWLSLAFEAFNQRKGKNTAR